MNTHMPPATNAFRLRRLNAFTLVELLIVIAIISILAALLLPVLQKARRSACMISCASQMKQHGLAMSGYENDWRALPRLWAWPNDMRPAGAEPPGTKYYIWHLALENNGLVPESTSASRPLFWCPRNRSVYTRAERINMGCQIDYALNSYYFARRWCRSSALRRPSETVMEADRRNKTDGGNATTGFIASTSEGYAPAAHLGGCNFLYFDLHYAKLERWETELFSYNKPPMWGEPGSPD